MRKKLKLDRLHPNLDIRKNEDGITVLVCDLAASDTDLAQQTGSESTVSAKAGWLRDVLSIKTDEPSEPDPKLLYFKDGLEAANEGCTLIEQLIDQLPGTSPTTILELTLPHPLRAA
jgi:hypothetical protein